MGMIFTKLGRIVAFVAVIYGFLKIGLAIDILQFDDPAAGAREYLGTRSTGQTIDAGIYTIIFGILVGVLTDISRSVSTKI